MKYAILFILILTFISSGCKEEEEVEKKKMAHLYVDILIADETYKHNQDSLKIITDSLYLYYDISQGLYKKEIEKFKFDEETWSEFFDLAEEYLDTLKTIEERRIAELKEDKSQKEDISN